MVHLGDHAPILDWRFQDEALTDTSEVEKGSSVYELAIVLQPIVNPALFGSERFHWI